MACGGPCGLDEANPSTGCKKVGLAGSARLGISEAGAGGAIGAKATDFAQTQQALTPSTCADRSRFESGVAPQISTSEISPASNLTARWLLPASALAINWNMSTRPQAAAIRPRPASRNVPVDIMTAD